jgi:hypothetical protein
MKSVALANVGKLFVLLALGAFILGHPAKAAAAACCSDCPVVDRIGQPPDCPVGSACYGCWHTCNNQCGGFGTCSILMCTCDGFGSCWNCGEYSFACDD